MRIPDQRRRSGSRAVRVSTLRILADRARVQLTRLTPGLGQTDGVFEHAETPTKWYKGPAPGPAAPGS